MKTKHILTALALPAMFAACAAEDIYIPLFDTSHFSDVNILNQIFSRIFIRRDPFSTVS